MNKEIIDMINAQMKPIAEQMRTNMGTMDYHDICTYYYEVIARKSITKGYGEKKIHKLLGRIDNWESYYSEQFEMGA